MKTLKVVAVFAAIAALAGGRCAIADQGATKPAATSAAQPAEPSTATKFIQLALVPPSLQLVNEDDSIAGVRLEIYGRNYNMSGVDLGLVHETQGNFRGVGFGLANLVHGDTVGLQLGGFYNETKGHMSGLQVGFFNHTKTGKGIQIGLVNFADDFVGFQFGLFNQINSKEVLPVLPIINAAF